jgi:hypothetical protein
VYSSRGDDEWLQERTNSRCRLGGPGLDGESSPSSRNDPSRAGWRCELDGAWEVGPYESASFHDDHSSGETN